MTIEVRDVDEHQYLLETIEGLEATIVSLEKRTYAAPHVWNLVAKQLRETYSILGLVGSLPEDRNGILAGQRTIEALALSFAKRFQEDEGFDPLTWLDKCSPDPELYPFSELWES